MGPGMVTTGGLPLADAHDMVQVLSQRAAAQRELS